MSEYKTIIVPVGDDHVAEIQTKFTVAIDAETEQAMIAVLESDDSKFSSLCKIAGMDIKTDLSAGNFEGLDVSNEGDCLEGANFRDSNLRHSIWRGLTSTKGILFEGTDLRGAKYLTEEDLAQAYINEETHLPEGIDRARVNYLHQKLNMPKPPPYEKDDGFIQIPVPAILHRKM